MDSTIGDFFQMVWEKRTRVILKLAETDQSRAEVYHNPSISPVNQVREKKKKN